MCGSVCLCCVSFELLLFLYIYYIFIVVLFCLFSACCLAAAFVWVCRRCEGVVIFVLWVYSVVVRCRYDVARNDVGIGGFPSRDLLFLWLVSGGFPRFGVSCLVSWGVGRIFFFV